MCRSFGRLLDPSKVWLMRSCRQLSIFRWHTCQWFLQVTQVLVDGKNFRAALADYDAARERSEGGASSTTQARLLAGRGLAHEGLGDWRSAVADYDTALQVPVLHPSPDV